MSWLFLEKINGHPTIHEIIGVVYEIGLKVYKWKNEGPVVGQSQKINAYRR